MTSNERIQNNETSSSNIDTEEDYQEFDENEPGNCEVDSMDTDMSSDLKTLHVNTSEIDKEVFVQINMGIEELRERIRELNERIKHLQG